VDKTYYFDHNATTPIAPEVLSAMLPYLQQHWGNPSSLYRLGQHAARALQIARVQVAELIEAEPKEIIFTSGGTESNNTALQSALVVAPGKGHILTTAVEHSANLRFCEDLGRRGYEVTYLPVDTGGALDLQLLEQSIRPDTALVSVMWANNETGVVFPVAAIGEICRRKQVLFHSDAVQAAGRLQIDAGTVAVDMLSLSGHKLHAPKGVGVLYVRRGTPFHPYLFGGQQGGGRRGGTENVASAVALGRAAELAVANLADQNTRVRRLRDRMEAAILEVVRGSWRNGAREPRLPNTSNIGFDSVEADGLLIQLDQLGICASSGSACTSGALEPSHVLKAMGLGLRQARGSIRLSLGVESTDDDMEYLLRHLPEIVRRLRALS
jgi:cysteine desulfurase